MCHDQQPPPLGAPKFQACRVCETTSNSKGKPRFRRVPARWAAAFTFWRPEHPPGKFGRSDYLCESHWRSLEREHGGQGGAEAACGRDMATGAEVCRLNPCGVDMFLRHGLCPGIPGRRGVVFGRALMCAVKPVFHGTYHVSTCKNTHHRPNVDFSSSF